MLSISVVIPIRNAVRTLPYCLAALAQLDPAPFEIVLVDNGSMDGSLPLVHAFAQDCTGMRIQVLQEPRRGASSARNTGLRAAQGEVIAFTDADCAPDSSWLCHLMRPFQDPTVGAVAGCVVAAPPASTLELFSALYTLQLPAQPTRHRHWTPWEGGYPTANFAVRHCLLEDLGGFDERVRIYGEDYDLCARLYARGAAIVYVPEARVAHYHRTTLVSMLRQAFGFGRSHPYLLHRHTTSGLWVDLPGFSFTWQRCPARAWVDLASADKKVLAILVLGALYGPCLWLLPLYGMWLSGLARRRMRRAGMAPWPMVTVTLVGLLLLKSAAMTAGRWWGSWKHTIVCV